MNLIPTSDFIGGMTIQFAEGAWRGNPGSGVAISDEAFDYIEPLVESACANWTAGHRYGVYETSVSERKLLLRRLRDQEKRILPSAAHADLVRGLADWIEAYCNDEIPVSIWGY
ncbi:hypothetical protein K3179_09600 [Qipengyuania sp. GH38]|uniref:hypothetical protein n=1 Tax=Qipengyuania intermedia TaxID=2867244 RepID=UPI001C87839F|nr:hypothetical protein [Qipengyuania intermedia]MBX7514799.1 hypothetical protein [Qipengyuania intermedia]